MALSLLIATPAYGSKVHTDYLHSMLALVRGATVQGVDVDVVTIGNNSLITKARNSFISYFAFQEKYSHLIYIDADVGLEQNTIPKLLKVGVDVIGCPVPLKGYDEDGLPVLNVGEIFSIDENGIADVEHIGNAVLVLSRNAVAAVVDGADVYKEDGRFSRGSALSETNFDVFKVGVVDGHYLPEDYHLCHRLRKLGFKIYADMNAKIRHGGTFEFEVSPQQMGAIIQKKMGKKIQPQKGEVVNLWDRLKTAPTKH